MHLTVGSVIYAARGFCFCFCFGLDLRQSMADSAGPKEIAQSTESENSAEEEIANKAAIIEHVDRAA